MTNYITQEAIVNLMKEYDNLKSDTRLELERAFNNELITGRHYQIMFCLFNIQLNVVQTIQLLGLSGAVFKEEYEELLETMEAVINGYRTKSKKKYKDCVPNSLANILFLLESQTINPMIGINEEVRVSLIKYLAANNKDKLATQALHQRTHGMPEDVEKELFNPDYDSAVYITYVVDEEYESPMNNKTTLTKETDAFYRKDKQNEVKKNNSFNFLVSKDATGYKRTLVKTENGYKQARKTLY